MQGKAFLIKVNTGPVETPTYEKILGQTGGSLSLGADTIDTTSKDSGNWNENEPSYNNWSFSAEGRLKTTDPAITALRTAHSGGKQILVQSVMPDGGQYEGTATITAMEFDGPHDDVMTYSLEFQGSGELAYTAPV